MASANVKEFTDQNFEQEVLQSPQLVLVDFWAEWCMPCLRLAPIIDSLADQYAGRVKIGKLDTEVSREVAQKYRVFTIPTMILFKGGQMVKTIVGLRSDKELKGVIDELV